MEGMYQTNVGTSICYVALKTKANNVFAKKCAASSRPYKSVDHHNTRNNTNITIKYVVQSCCIQNYRRRRISLKFKVVRSSSCLQL